MATQKMTAVNPKRLKFAREYYNEEIFEVAKNTKIDASKIQKYENGDDFPSYSELNKFSDYYKKPLLFFFFKSDPVEDDLIVAFRSIEQSENKILTKQNRELIEKAKAYQLNLKELLSDSDTVPFIELIKKEKVTKNNFSVWLRNKLKISIESQIIDYSNSSVLLEDFRDNLFNIGIYVFKDAFKDSNVSGLCLFHDKYPVIILNNKTTFNRQLFTLFHEVYHIFCKTNDVEYIKREEKDCDIFASEFLIPKSRLLSEIKNNAIDEKYIDRLSNAFCVSNDAMAYKLYSLNKISKSLYEKIHEKSSNFRARNGNPGGSYYFTKKAYLGNGYIDTVYSKYYSGKISISQVGIYTQMKASTAKAFSSKVFGGGF